MLTALTAGAATAVAARARTPISLRNRKGDSGWISYHEQSELPMYTTTSTMGGGFRAG